MHYVHKKINDIFIMGLILMHRYPKTILLKYFFLEMFSADPVNDLIVVIRFVVSLLNSKFSKTLASFNSTIAKIV